MIAKSRVIEIFKLAKNKRVFSCGDVMLDVYFSGTAERLSQEAPVPIVLIEKQTFFPGGAGNAAACMAATGIKPTLVSLVGKDKEINYTSILKKECKNKKINPVFIQDKSRKTTLKLRVAAAKTTKQHIVRIDIEDITPLNKQMEDNLIKLIKKTFKNQNFSAISIHDYKKGFLTKKIFSLLADISKEKNIPVFADLKQDTFFKLKNCIKNTKLFFLKPNRSESAATAKLINGFDKDGISEKEIKEIAKIIQKDTPINITITRGKKGAVLFETGKKPYFIRLEDTEEQFDVAGAGDTVEALFIASYLGEANMRESLEIAVIASQIAIRKFGTSVVSPEEILKYIDHYK